MEGPSLIGVKFCGQCAPHLDLWSFDQQLRREAPELPLRLLAEVPAPGLVLVLNACPAGCAARTGFPCPSVSVTSEGVDGWPVPREQLCRQTIRRLRQWRGGP